jgi:hypothetical protein
MNEAELLFATFPTDSTYQLRLPTDNEYLNISNFSSHVFPHVSHHAQKAIEKLISLSDNMCSLSQL